MIDINDEITARSIVEYVEFSFFEPAPLWDECWKEYKSIPMDKRPNSLKTYLRKTYYKEAKDRLDQKRTIPRKSHIFLSDIVPSQQEWWLRNSSWALPMVGVYGFIVAPVFAMFEKRSVFDLWNDFRQYFRPMIPDMKRNCAGRLVKMNIGELLDLVQKMDL